MKKLTVLLFLLVTSMTIYGQSGSIKGKVVDENGAPLPGANVIVVNTELGAATDADGNYTIKNIPVGTYTLRAQFVGYDYQTVKNVVVSANKTTVVNFNMTSGVIASEEIVVVGYGVQQKRDVTGSSINVSVDDIKKIPTTHIGNALVGAAPGVSVSNATGAPGASPRITIRGTGTLGNNNPLYIVDGVPTSISNVNPSDIVSMNILKDASLAAIYGSRAANGVIIVKTNRGEKTSPDEKDFKIKFSSYFASSSATEEFPFITDKDQYVKLAKQALANAGIDYKTEYGADHFLNIYDNNPSAYKSWDWEDEYFRTAFERKHDISISGFSNNFNYAVMGMYSNTEGIVKTTDSERMSLRINSDFKGKRYKIGQSFSVGKSRGHGRYKSAYSFYAISRMAPITPIYDNTPSGYGSQRNMVGLDNIQVNPILENELNKNKWDNLSLMMSGYLEYNLLKDLKYTFRLSQNIYDGYGFSFEPSYYTNDVDNNPTAKMSETRSREYHNIMETFLNYDKTFGDHAITAMAGYSEESTDYRSTYGYAQEFPSNDLQVLGAGEKGDDASGWANEWRLRSFFGRLTYSYMDKYLFTANIRRDGSSRFDEDNRWGTFPSFSLGWRLSKEKFFKVPYVTDFKIRGGYGELGLQEFNDYQFLAKIAKDINSRLNYPFGTGRDQVIYVGARAINFPSVGIKWETSKETNLGFDLSMFNDRFTMTFDYYMKESEGILFGVPIPKSAGAVSNPVVNSASIDNNGVEISLAYKNYDNEFKYRASATVSAYSNEVTKMGQYGDESIWGGSIHWSLDNTTKTVVGQELASFYLYETRGLDENGDVIYVDQNGDGKITEDDKKFMGSAAPDAEFGLNFNASYKNFDFTINLFASVGRKMINGGRWLTMYTDKFHAMHEDLLNSWTPENKNTDIPRMIYGDKRNMRASDMWLEDADYLRIKYIEIGYTLPKHLTDYWGIGSFRVYVAAENLHTFTSYSGYDPSVDSYEGGSLFDRGADRSPYPLARKFLTGIQVGL